MIKLRILTFAAGPILQSSAYICYKKLTYNLYYCVKNFTLFSIHQFQFTV